LWFRPRTFTLPGASICGTAAVLATDGAAAAAFRKYLPPFSHHHHFGSKMF
jgi:hypothetical protein